MLITMSPSVKVEPAINSKHWDAYVQTHPQATLYHLYGWKTVIENTYGHKTYYLMATNTNRGDADNSQKGEEVVGVLPLVHLKHFIFGNALISIPFFDMGGILADSPEIEENLLSKAVTLGRQLKVKNIELRHAEPLLGLGESFINQNCQDLNLSTRSHKVRMLLELSDSSEALMKGFKSKLRSQIKKPLKEGLQATLGGIELLDDFYKIFLINMRDLGSPVHSDRLMRCLFEQFPETSKIVIIHKSGVPVAGSIVSGFRNTLQNPWASSLREYSRLSPNMLLYWTMLEYACDQGYQYFDFGRSTPEEGTYKFKEQWGAKPMPLQWYYISFEGLQVDEDSSEQSRFDKAIQYWQKLPVPVTRIIGPMLRKHIGL